MRLEWGKGIRPLLITWGVSSVIFLGFPHVLQAGIAAIPFVLVMGAMVTLLLGVPAVLILLVVDALRGRSRRDPEG